MSTHRTVLTTRDECRKDHAELGGNCPDDSFHNDSGSVPKRLDGLLADLKHKCVVGVQAAGNIKKCLTEMPCVATRDHGGSFRC